VFGDLGGLTGSFVDLSWLTERVVGDVLASALDRARQSCSALRVLCLQDDIAEHTLQMLRGAMAECRMGNPGRLTTDIGPVNDSAAKANIERPLPTIPSKGRPVVQAAPSNSANPHDVHPGHFFMHPLFFN
ncbi:aldehyde dehydrogenase family protein, partial [Salmonella enterica]|uniref:aldehyde dehydrogenase family protein n=1 Tax=Salmonella enterica TaxID=28901 RepID=UPI00398C553E